MKIGEGCFIGAGAVIRGDYGSIVIGDRTSIQENTVIHAREKERTTIGSDVQVGHGSVVLASPVLFLWSALVFYMERK